MSKPDIIGFSWGQIMPLNEMLEIEAAAKLSYTVNLITSARFVNVIMQ